MRQFEFLQDIGQYPQWIAIEPVNKGWSKDRKFCIERQDGVRLLLRLSDYEQYQNKQREYAAMQKFHSLGIRMSEPLEFGVCGDGCYVYSLLSWLDGEALDDVLSSMSEQEQYELGFRAGKILYRIHSVPAPADQPEWEQRMVKKLRVHLQRYSACEYKVPRDKLALQYLEDNLPLLKNRPQSLQHGDFHPGNMILSDNGQLGIIDFNRWDYGDPYEEFYKMMLFSREQSIPFVRGQIAGYFGDNAPDLFFRLLALYLADVILFSVVWATNFGSDEIQGMLKRAEMILDDYAGFSSYRPTWL